MPDIQLVRYAAPKMEALSVLPSPMPQYLKRSIGQEVFKVKAAVGDDGYLWGEGWASKDTIDVYNEIVRPDAFNESLPAYMQHPMMLYMHDWFGMPVGMVTELEIREHGIWTVFKIFPTDEGKNLMTVIREGLIDSLSVGFTVDKGGTEYDEKTKITTITKGKLYEISVVNLAANPDALFDISKGHPASMLTTKSFNIDNIKKVITETGGDEGGRQDIRRYAMPQTDVAEMHAISKSVDSLTKRFDDVDAKVDSFDKLSGELDKLKGEIQKKVDEVKSGVATIDSLNDLTKNIESDFADVQEKLNRLENQKDIVARRGDMLSWMAKMVHNRGREKMDIILRTPVNYKSHPEGDLLKALRDQFDLAYMVDAYMRGNGRPYGGIHTLKSWKAFVDLLGYFAPEEAKAMATSNTGQGLEWVFTGWSRVFHDLYDLERKIERFIPSFELPTKDFEWPGITAHGIAYPMSEAARNNPEQLRKTNWGTGKTTFHAQDFAVAYLISANLTEDSVIAIGPVVQAELILAMNSAFNDALINGNNDATVNGEVWTNDFDTGYTTWDLMKCKSLIQGLRLHASDLSATIDFASTTAGVGDGAATFGPKDTMSLFMKMGKMAAQNEVVKLVMPLEVYLKTLCFDVRTQSGTYGGPGVYNTRERLMYFGGYEMVIDPDYPIDMATTGIYDGSVKTDTGELAFNPREFKIGNYRPITAEYQKDILTGQMAFVATMRKDMRKMAIASLFPVAAGYGITTAGL